MDDVKGVIGIGFRYNNKYSRRNPLRHCKPKRTMFFLNSEGKLKTARINFLQSLYYNRIKVLRLVVECSRCEKKFAIMVRKKSLKGYICAECSK